MFKNVYLFGHLLYFTLTLLAGKLLLLLSTCKLLSWWQISPRRINLTINLPVLNLARGHLLCFAQIKIDDENFVYSSSSSVHAERDFGQRC